MKKNNKYIKYAILILFIVGIVLLALGYSKSAFYDDNGEGEVGNKYPTELEEMLSGIEGIGEMKIMISQSKDGESIRINGVAVICQGGDNPNVVKDIIGIVEAVCGVSSNRIYVAHMKN